jgi:hypothetical protein
MATKLIPGSLRRWAPMIEEIEDFRSQGTDGDGYWVHLKPGFINTLHEVHSVHEDNIGQCVEVFKSDYVKPCACQGCKDLIAKQSGKGQIPAGSQNRDWVS